MWVLMTIAARGEGYSTIASAAMALCATDTAVFSCKRVTSRAVIEARYRLPGVKTFVAASAIVAELTAMRVLMAGQTRRR